MLTTFSSSKSSVFSVSLWLLSSAMLIFFVLRKFYVDNRNWFCRYCSFRGPVIIIKCV